MKFSAKILTTLAKEENISPEKLTAELQSGRAVLLGQQNPILFGGGGRTKVGVGGMRNFLPNADFFVCTEICEKKLIKILKMKKVPTGTIPLYSLVKFEYSRFLRVLENQLKLGVDFVVLSPGVTMTSFPALQKRKSPSSKSATLLLAWMTRHKSENPLFTRFEEILAIIRKYSATLYFATSLRPGNFFEVGDIAELQELEILGRLVTFARSAGVSVLVEGPDLLPFHKIVEQIILIRDLTYGAPLILRGPRVLERDMSAQSASLGGVLASLSGVAGLLTDTLGIKQKNVLVNYHALVRAAEAGNMK